jgi:hypothetical protein
MGTRLDKIIIDHCRKTLPVRRRTSPVSWRCVLVPVVTGICNLIDGPFDPYRGRVPVRDSAARFVRSIEDMTHLIIPYADHFKECSCPHLD